jgi:hypothetical protein
MLSALVALIGTCKPSSARCVFYCLADDFLGQTDFLMNILRLHPTKALIAEVQENNKHPGFGNEGAHVAWLSENQVQELCRVYKTLKNVSNANPADLAEKVNCSFFVALVIKAHCHQYMSKWWRAYQ